MIQSCLYFLNLACTVNIFSRCLVNTNSLIYTTRRLLRFLKYKDRLKKNPRFFRIDILMELIINNYIFFYLLGRNIYIPGNISII
jgi:hypothetical protein